MHDEFATIDRLKEIFAEAPEAPEVSLAIGDDCAIVDPSKLAAGEQLVWTLDASVEGVHFRRALLDWDDVGYRATVAAISDVFAMGARAIAALVGWTLPDDLDDDAILAIACGQREAAIACGATIVGGNLARGESLSLTTTVFGATARPIRRDGAKIGDRLALAGAVGEAALGFAWLARGRPASAAPRIARAWCRPHPRPDDAKNLAGVAHAMIDVSDGLAQDLGHLARASGVRAVIDCASLRAIRSEEARETARAIGANLEDMELAGGEDYALVAAIPADRALPTGCVEIGRCESGSGVAIVGEDGVWREAPEGYRHRRGGV